MITIYLMTKTTNCARGRFAIRTSHQMLTICDLLIPFTQMHMETFVKIIIKRLKDANLFVSQGGLIILAQVSQSKLLWQPLLLKVSFWPV